MNTSLEGPSLARHERSLLSPPHPSVPSTVQFDVGLALPSLSTRHTGEPGPTPPLRGDGEKCETTGSSGWQVANATHKPHPPTSKRIRFRHPGRSVCVLTLLSLSLLLGRSLAAGRALKPDSSPPSLSLSAGGVHACACASQKERKHVLRTEVREREREARQPLPPSPAPCHTRLVVVPRGRASSIDIPCACVCACVCVHVSSHRRSSAQLSLSPLRRQLSTCAVGPWHDEVKSRAMACH